MRKLAFALALLSGGCSPTAEQQRAVTVAQCMAGVAAAVPPEELMPREPKEYSIDDVILAIAVVNDIRACTRLPEADAGQ